MHVQRWLLAATLALATLAGPAMAVEEPAFELVLREGDFEVRDYPALVVAEVTVSGDQKDAANAGFRLLAAYIFGGNTRRESIAMTAPVAQQAAGEKIAMTARDLRATGPVSLAQYNPPWTLWFMRRNEVMVELEVEEG